MDTLEKLEVSVVGAIDQTHESISKIRAEADHAMSKLAALTSDLELILTQVQSVKTQKNPIDIRLEVTEIMQALTHKTLPGTELNSDLVHLIAGVDVKVTRSRKNLMDLERWCFIRVIDKKDLFKVQFRFIGTVDKKDHDWGLKSQEMYDFAQVGKIYAVCRHRPIGSANWISAIQCENEEQVLMIQDRIRGVETGE